MMKTPAGENAAHIVLKLLEYNTVNLNHLYRKEASIDACE